MDKIPKDDQRVSIIVPTYKEAVNLPILIARIEAVLKAKQNSFELIIVDDDSQDGTEELIRKLELPWARFIKRIGRRGLATAVIEGLEVAKYNTFVVMDADLSHGPENIPDLLDCLNNGADFVVGSRYIEGGTTAHDWGFLRWINSRVATLLSRPFTNITDPMSGFFCLSRETLSRAENLNPVGYKIGLELIVKCKCKNVREIPIHFANRLYGESKLSLKEQIAFISHIRRLWMFKFRITAGAGFNYLPNRFFVFKRRHYLPDTDRRFNK